jgi:hypothetical protein
MNHKPECIWWDTENNLVGDCDCSYVLAARTPQYQQQNAAQKAIDDYQRGYDQARQDMKGDIHEAWEGGYGVGYRHGLQDGRKG